jgi:hypothetical protein
MKGEFKYTKREGLPKGANEVKQHIEGQFSIHGYKADSPDVNNSFNIIPSGDITMKGVDFPVHGVDNLGNSQIMYPGNDYKFPGSSVFETPLRDSDDYEEAELTDEEIADLRAQGYVVEEYQNGGTTNKIPFEDWYKTVPEYKNDTTSYNLRRAYELAPQEELDAFVNTDAHLRSAYKQPNGIYEFVKRKDHPTVQNEIDWFNSAEATDFRKQYRLDDSGDYYRYIPIKQDGGVNPLEGDLFAKVLMERNRDKEFVKRAFNPEDYPDHVQHNEDGTTSTHRMAWGTDDTGQAYMFPTIFNEANEAIPVPNQYADYISSQGYKRATGMDKYQTGREVKYKGDDLYEARYMLPPVEITGTPSFAKDLPYYDYLKPEEKEWLRKNKNSDDAITRSIRAQAEEGYGIDGNPTYGQSAYEAALTPFREMGTIAAEETGIPAAYRIAQNPMNTLEGLANTALDLQALPITAIQAMLDYDNADLSINPLTGNPYGSGLVQTGDALTMLPAAGFLGAGLKKGAKYVKPAKAFNRTVEGASPAEIKQLRNSRGRIVGADNPQFERFYSSPDVRINSPFTERLPEGPFYEKLSPLVEDMINTKIARSLDPRGKKLIINQEKEYLKSIGVKPEHLDELAEKGYNARIEELETILDNKAWFHTPQHNAYRTGYTPANAYTDDNFWLKYTDKKPLKLDELYTIDDVRADPSLYNKINRLKRQQRKVHALVPLDNTLSFGNMFVDPRTIAHELAHVSQASRRLPIEKRLREAASPYGVRKGKLNLSKSLQEDYDYFADDFMRKGKPARGGIEPYAFAHETKQALLDKGIIKDWFEPITEETLFRARRHFDNRPSGIYDWNEQKFSSDSRMLDFTHPSRFGMLAKELNKIAPAVLPVAGAASLADYQTGGEKVYTDKEEYNKAMQMYSDSLNAAQAYNNIINLANSGKYPFTEGTVEGWSASDDSDPVVTDLKVWQKGKDFKESFKDFDNYNELEKDIDVLRNSPLTPSRIKIFENKGNIDDMPIFPNPFSDPSYGIQDALMFTLAEFEYPRTKPKYEELKPVEKKESPVVKVEKKEPVKKEEIKSDPLSKAKRVVDGYTQELKGYNIDGKFYTLEEKPWEDEDIKTFLEQPNMVRSSPWLQGILKQKQEWEAANPPADTVETSPTPEVKITPDDSQLKSDDVGSYNNPDLYAQPEAPTSELDKAIINRDVKAYSDIVNPFAIDYSYTPKVEEPKEEIKAEEPQKVVKDTIQTDGTFDNFEIIQPTKPKTEVEITPEKETRVISETDEEFQFIPADIPGTYNIPDETYNSITQKYYDQNEKADAKMQELYYTITNPSVSQEEKDSAQKQFDELKELQKLNVAEINRVKKRQTGAFDVLLQEEGPAWLSKGLQKVGFADDYSLEAPPGEKLYEDYETKAKRDYEQELVTKSYESLNTPSEANQWYRWKYRVNASNDDPVTVQLYGNRGERDKKDPNIKGLGAMMHFLDQSPLTGSSHSSMKNFYNRLSDNQYIGYLQKGDGENYQLMYKKVGEIPKDELTSQNTFYLRTEDFDNINFDGKRVVDDNFAGHTYWTKKDDGEATIPISIGHNDNDYNYSSGNAVVYIFDHKGQRRYIHFAGSPNAIKKEGERIKKDYNLKDNSLTIGIADAGSYASAVKADKQGNINNKLLNSKDYGYWNLNSYTGAGMVLQDDFKSGGEYMEAELTPEEINWYLSQGYRVDELE